jgi:hypothetical protein
MRSLVYLTAVAASVLSGAQASSLTPPVLPLIVRNPYLSTWLGNARDVPWSKWPMFYTGQEVGCFPECALASSLTSNPSSRLGSQFLPASQRRALRIRYSVDPKTRSTRGMGEYRDNYAQSIL